MPELQGFAQLSKHAKALLPVQQTDKLFQGYIFYKYGEGGGVDGRWEKNKNEKLKGEKDKGGKKNWGKLHKKQERALKMHWFGL